MVFSDFLMRQYMLRLKEKDTTLYLKLEQQEIRPQFYAFRWLTLLLSQEFPLPGIKIHCNLYSAMAVNNKWHIFVPLLYRTFPSKERVKTLIVLTRYIIQAQRLWQVHSTITPRCKRLYSYIVVQPKCLSSEGSSASKLITFSPCHKS